MAGPDRTGSGGALVEDLGLHPGEPHQWFEDAFDESNDRSLWMLFTTAGRGYEAAVASPTEGGQWIADVDQWCPDTAPLPLATNATPAPTAKLAWQVPPAPGPGPDGPTLARATYGQASGRNRPTGTLWSTRPTPTSCRTSAWAAREA